jgi:hypothetical protein
MNKIFFICMIIIGLYTSSLQAQNVFSRQAIPEPEPIMIVIEFLNGNGITKNPDRTVTVTSPECVSILQQFNLPNVRLMLLQPNFNLADTLTKLPSGAIVRDVDYSNFVQMRIVDMKQGRSLVTKLNQLKSIVFNAYIKPRKMNMLEND